MSTGGRDFSAPLPAFRGYLSMMLGRGKEAAAKNMAQDTEIGKAVQSARSASALAGCKELIARLFAESEGLAWELTCAAFEAALERSARKRFVGNPTQAQLETYLGALHIKDLALACACAEGHTAAWEHFVAAYRAYLRSAAGIILQCASDAPAACELADSLFAELFGLTEGKRSERSVFRYFHGRSSLKTWLRAVLAQRHIDGIRAGRRFSSLPDEPEENEFSNRTGVEGARPPLSPDPHRERYVALFTRTLEVALGLLDQRDKERLRLYYAEEQTLAEIGRKFGEHESSVSRNLERTRRELRHNVEAALRKGRAAANGFAAQAGLSEEEISLCFEYATEDSPIDLEKLFPEPHKRKTAGERHES